MFEEFLNRHFEKYPEDKELFRHSSTPEQVFVHGHCHAKALTGTEPTMEALRSVGLDPVDLKTGCCGMAGSFGYEADKYEVSMDIGELSLFPQLRGKEEDALICAPGFSCRHQIADGVEKEGHHPAQLVARQLV